MKTLDRWYRRGAVIIATTLAVLLVPSLAWAHGDAAADPLAKGKAVGAVGALAALCCIAVVAVVVLAVVLINRRRHR